MVAPERETPGISAAAWNRPYRMPCGQVRSFSSRVLRAPRRSATASTIATPASIATVIHRLRSVESIASWNSSPSTTMGTEPTMTSQPIRASGSPLATFPVSEPIHCVMIRQMSRRKYTSTAVSVPSCVTAVNAAPGSRPSKKTSVFVRLVMSSGLIFVPAGTTMRPSSVVTGLV